MKLRMLLPLAIAATTLGGCVYDDYGYGGVNVGYGVADPYYGYNAGYGGLGGWYNDFYYPGTGVYVIDRRGGRHRWNDDQRRYWENRGRQNRPGWGGRGDGRPDRGRWEGRRDGDRPSWQRPGGSRPQGQWQGRPQGGEERGTQAPTRSFPGAGQTPRQQPSVTRPQGQRPSMWQGQRQGGPRMGGGQRGQRGEGRSPRH